VRVRAGSDPRNLFEVEMPAGIVIHSMVINIQYSMVFSNIVDCSVSSDSIIKMKYSMYCLSLL